MVHEIYTTAGKQAQQGSRVGENSSVAEALYSFISLFSVVQLAVHLLTNVHCMLRRECMAVQHLSGHRQLKSTCQQRRRDRWVGVPTTELVLSMSSLPFGTLHHSL